MGVELVVSEGTLGRVAEGALHLGAALCSLQVIALEAGVAEAVHAVTAAQYPCIR